MTPTFLNRCQDLSTIKKEAKADLMALDERFNARKYLEYKLMMGFDERYAITRPVGDWKSIPTLYIEDIKPEPVVQ